MEAGKYSQRVLDMIKCQRRILIDEIRRGHYEIGRMKGGAIIELYEIYDSPPVQVAELSWSIQMPISNASRIW